MVRRSTALQASAAIVALAVGLFVYLLDRQPANIYFIPDWLPTGDSVISIFGGIGNFLPTFIHAFSFILLTVIFISPTPKQTALICVLWLTIDSLFEIGQFTPIAQWIAVNLPDWFSGIPIIENTSSYFINGTFDFWDLASIVAGTIAAYMYIQISQNDRRHHASN